MSNRYSAIERGEKRLPVARLIIDEFTDLPVSRQRKKQLRWHRDGRCEICGEPCAPYILCVRHAVYRRELAHRQAGCTRRNNTQSYRREAANDQNTSAL
jgi:hypothetical protein